MSTTITKLFSVFINSCSWLGQTMFIPWTPITLIWFTDFTWKKTLGNFLCIAKLYDTEDQHLLQIYALKKKSHYNIPDTELASFQLEVIRNDALPQMAMAFCMLRKVFVLYSACSQDLHRFLGMQFCHPDVWLPLPATPVLHRYPVLSVAASWLQPETAHHRVTRSR